MFAACLRAWTLIVAVGAASIALIDHFDPRTHDRTVKAYVELLGPQYEHRLDEWQQQLRLLQEDPALRYFSTIPASWLARDTAETRAMVARNLYFARAPVSMTAVQEEEAHIHDVRASYDRFMLLRGRNVLLVSAHEPWPDGERFGTTATREALCAEAGEYHEYQLPGTPPDVLLKAIETSVLPVTVVYDAHGTPDTLAFEGSTSITADALAATLRRRWQHRAGAPDAFVLHMCHSHEFARNVYDHLGDTPLPILTGPNEYGQLGVSAPQSPYHNDYFPNIIGLGTPGPRTLGTLWNNEEQCRSRTCSDGNPFIYVPDRKNRLTQIS